MTIEVANQAGVKNLALTHHDPRSNDGMLKNNQSLYRKQFADLFYAREGLSVSL
jgi:ribonuclease BN (tRNA processing enzyme)